MKYIISHFMHIYTSHYILLESKIGKCGDLPNVNDVLSGFLVLLELAAVYQDILSKGGRHLLSPQVHISSILRIYFTLSLKEADTFSLHRYTSPQFSLKEAETSTLHRYTSPQFSSISYYLPGHSP